MFKLVIGLLVVAIFPKLYETAVAIYPKEDKPPEFASEEGCYSKALNRVIGPGDTFYNAGKQCASYECRDNGDIFKYTCGEITSVRLGCRVVEGDLNLKYPDCCPSVVCRKINGPIIIKPTERPPIL